MRAKLSWAVVVIVSMTLGGASVVGLDSLRSDEPRAPSIIQSVSPSVDGVAVTALADVADLYEVVRPSVVRISTQSGRGGGGLGSGVIIDTDGHILTNFHVIDGASQIDVRLADGTSALARVVGTDPGNDLAVIEADLPTDKLVAATLGNSGDVRIGEFVIAVGNPFDIEGSLTQGVVSGVGRTLASGAGRPLRQLIQSDAAINPGNSGGALFNQRGEVIGITTAIENPSGDRVFVGIGYAVPIDTARRFLPELLQGSTIEHPRMGVALQNVTPSLAERLNLGVEAGVLITTVERGSAADRAGLQGGLGGNSSGTGDVIVALDGEPVTTFETLAQYIDDKDVGDRIEVEIVRDGERQSVSVTLEAWQSS